MNFFQVLIAHEEYSEPKHDDLNSDVQPEQKVLPRCEVLEELKPIVQETAIAFLLAHFHLLGSWAEISAILSISAEPDEESSRTNLQRLVELEVSLVVNAIVHL